MKKYLLFIFCLINLGSYSQQWQLVKKINAIPSDFNLNDIALDASGNYYLATSVYNVGAYTQIKIGKYTSAGLLMWSDATNIGPTYHPGKIKIRNNHLYLAVHDGFKKFFIVKYDLGGGKKQVSAITGTDDFDVNDFYIDKNQNLYLTGNFSDTCYFNSSTLAIAKGNNDLFVAKYTYNDSLVFFKQGWSMDTIPPFASQQYVKGQNIVVNSDGEIIITVGYNNGFIISDSLLDNYSNNDGWKIASLKLDTLDKITPLFQGNSTCSPMCSSYQNMFLAKNDNLYFLENNWYAHASNSMVNKYEKNGTFKTLLGRHDGDTGGSAIESFCVDSVENIFLVFNTCWPYPNPVYHIGVARYGSSVSLQWKDSVISNKEMYFNQIVNDNSGNLFITGLYRDTLILGNNLLINNSGNLSWFIAKLKDTLSVNGIPLSDPKEEVLIYPNPSFGTFTVDLRNYKNVKICIYDILGSCVLSKSYGGGVSPQIDLSKQAKGIYFMVVRHGDQKSTQKIIIE